MTVMIVEDNPRMRDSIKALVLRHSTALSTIYECANGEQALEDYKRFHPDLVLMDIEMEPVDGLAASRSIKRLHPEARIVIVTNYDDSGYRKLAMEVGIEGYVLKENLTEILEFIPA